MSTRGGSSIYDLLLRQIKKGDLYRIWLAPYSSSRVTSSTDHTRNRWRDRKSVTSVQQQQRASSDSAKFPNWIDVDRETSQRPGSFRSRNVSFERFFDARSRQGKSSAREQWTQRNVLSNRPRSSEGSWNKDYELPKVDYENLNLPAIQKNLYRENPSVTSRSEEEINGWFTHNEVILKGKSFPRPIFEFDEAGFPSGIVEKLRMASFEKPTYTLPGIVHMQNQQHSKIVQGPAVLILAPTRELVQQISSMTMNFHSKVASAYGGSGREQQARTIRAGIDILAAAPGRLLDFLISGVLNLQRCTYLVLDEADRMLDMGFEPQIRKIISMIRPERQTLMFSATWPREVRNLAKDFLTDPVFVNVGSLKLAANSNIKQMVEVVGENQKEEKLLEFLGKISSERHCKTLIFVGMKRTADWLTRLVRKEGYPALSLHGDKSQTERNFVMNDFKNGECSVLIATDVAARGLDVNDIKYVINFDSPRNIEDYIHRIGRTARHNKTGTSYTLCTFNDVSIASDLVDVLKETKQRIPSDLLDLASGRSSAKYSRGRF
uniref:RNA helicase n=1 Tax=Setaria digitata TaxID=48799 RepID=A0A915PQZ8_9BILA